MYVIKEVKKNCFKTISNIRTIRSKIEYRLCCTSSQWRIGGGRGEGARDACPLVGPNSLIFMQFTAKICKTIAWCTSLGSLRPLANPGPATDSWQLICSLSNNIFTRLIAYIVDHVSISIKVTLSTYKVKEKNIWKISFERIKGSMWHLENHNLIQSYYTFVRALLIFYLLRWDEWFQMDPWTNNAFPIRGSEFCLCLPHWSRHPRFSMFVYFLAYMKTFWYFCAFYLSSLHGFSN